MGSGFVAMDGELQAAVVKKEIFLPLQDRWKSSQKSESLVWPGPSLSPQNRSALG